MRHSSQINASSSLLSRRYNTPVMVEHHKAWFTRPEILASLIPLGLLVVATAGYLWLLSKLVNSAGGGGGGGGGGGHKKGGHH